MNVSCLCHALATLQLQKYSTANVNIMLSTLHTVTKLRVM